jgi:hypothetical protein
MAERCCGEPLHRDFRNKGELMSPDPYIDSLELTISRLRNQNREILIALKGLRDSCSGPNRGEIEDEYAWVIASDKYRAAMRVADAMMANHFYGKRT